MLTLTASITGCLGSRHASNPGINDEVRDGHFAFTVTVINVGVPKTGNRTAEGAFVVVNLMVKNISGAPRAFYCQNQTLRDFGGKKYDDAVNLDSREDRVNIDPGSGVKIRCAFDVPQGALPAAVELRDSPYSRGVRVALLAGS